MRMLKTVLITADPQVVFTLLFFSLYLRASAFRQIRSSMSSNSLIARLIQASFPEAMKRLYRDEVQRLVFSNDLIDK